MGWAWGLAGLGWVTAPTSTNWNWGQTRPGQVPTPLANSEVKQAVPDCATAPNSTYETWEEGSEPDREDVGTPLLGHCSRNVS